MKDLIFDMKFALMFVLGIFFSVAIFTATVADARVAYSNVCRTSYGYYFVYHTQFYPVGTRCYFYLAGDPVRHTGFITYN